MNQIAWKVFLYGKHIETVFYNNDCNKEWVLDGLINHDGFNPNIRVKKWK